MAENMSQNFISKIDLDNFKAGFVTEIEHYLEEKLGKTKEVLSKNFKKMIDEKMEVSSEILSTEYDSDNDVIMRSRINAPVRQVPEPGFFSGDTNQTELFCELCSATFKTYPNNQLPEDVKINFVQSRLRDSARIWYRIKYKFAKKKVLK